MNKDAPDAFRYVRYDSARENEYVAAMRQLISKDLSEPYSIYVYRYFLYQWGDLCFLALDKDDTMVGVVVSKLETHRGGPMRGYIAMLAVREEYRGRGIATQLVRMAIDAMIARNADEVGIFASFFSIGRGDAVFLNACADNCFRSSSKPKSQTPPL
jgi:peptide alpha-N-acetyltransferase